MKKIALAVLGLLMLAAGVLWTLQGLGYIGGSAMSDEQIWAVIGPLVAGLGVALLITVFKPHP